MRTVTLDNIDNCADQQQRQHLVKEHPRKRLDYIMVGILCAKFYLREQIWGQYIFPATVELSSRKTLGILQGVALIESKGSIW